MTTPKRLSYYIDNAGPDGKAIRLAFRWLVETARLVGHAA